MFGQQPNGRAVVPDDRPFPSVPLPWTGAQRLVRVSNSDSSDVVAISPFAEPQGWVIAPPLAHDDIIVTFDSGNRRLAGLRVDSTGRVERLWEHPFRHMIQPMVYPATRELVVDDEREVDGRLHDDVVVLDLDTGAEMARVTAGCPANGMFPCPGWSRDRYYCTWFDVARIVVD